MTKYVLTRPHFIHRTGADTPVLVEAGETIEWGDLDPSLGMAGVDEDGEAKCKKRDEKLRAQKDEAVASGRISRVVADSLPKAEPAPELPDEDDEPHGRGRRRR